MYGTTCFDCGGSGKVATKLTAGLLVEVKTQVAAGELAPYLERLRRKAAAKRYSEMFFAAWESLLTVAADKGKHFMSCSERCHEINAFVAPLCDESRITSAEVENCKRWDKDAKKYIALTDVEMDERLARLDAILDLVRNAETLAPAKN
jgi:hypothetical protein